MKTFSSAMRIRLRQMFTFLPDGDPKGSHLNPRSGFGNKSKGRKARLWGDLKPCSPSNLVQLELFRRNFQEEGVPSLDDEDIGLPSLLKGLSLSEGDCFKTKNLCFSIEEVKKMD